MLGAVIAACVIGASQPPPWPPQLPERPAAAIPSADAQRLLEAHEANRSKRKKRTAD